MPRDPQGCVTCKRLCKRTVLFTVPRGWTRIRDPRNGTAVLLCPTCK